ncbi:rare lipoprotein A [Fulvimarina manganoxydans]|uniref:Endolytic peptidoglycan transglycosylase RlpA n=1 Tax=Fulvimarina manganoxydans TaxID=937218 RepID=A0A1W2EHY7_9HYPH|nr:septal ring lytic transglycosylase RlpA family protein [Fulvimarina manganoxydans]MCK5933096.1 septal ring lytic transglycosylase RlpA family protein [Fulvimarina manganoxydans]MEE2950619.1 septal ring lytic transglycosylase RlpA family protein [Pseudomonadota bacterium]SMD08778.1 rare lipoprotein A [Fulvimarina manganoxydans]
MKFTAKAVLTAAVLAFASAGATVATTEVVYAGSKASAGTASYYGKRFHGRTTANGERFNMNAMTAAHKSLPFGTKVKVTNRNNGKSVVVRINDRGPYHGNRVIDLSRGAAAKIGMLNSGTARVSIQVL